MRASRQKPVIFFFHVLLFGPPPEVIPHIWLRFLTSINLCSKVLTGVAHALCDVISNQVNNHDSFSQCEWGGGGVTFQEFPSITVVSQARDRVFST